MNLSRPCHSATFVVALILAMSASADQSHLSRSSAIRIARKAAEAKGYSPSGNPYTHYNADLQLWDVRWWIASDSPYLQRNVNITVRSKSLQATLYPPGFHLFGWQPQDETIIDVPSEIALFVAPGEIAIELESNDLNGDGRADYLLVTERQDADGRVAKILIQQPDGTFLMEGRNDRAIPCLSCGGARQPDGFAGATLGYRTFDLEFISGGGELELRETFTFDYNPVQRTWELTSAKSGDARYRPSTGSRVKFEAFDSDPWKDMQPATR
jgi:hypothetical protein